MAWDVARAAGSILRLSEKVRCIRSSLPKSTASEPALSACARPPLKRFVPMQRKKAKSKRRFRLNTPAEEARIQAGIKSDPDNPELTPGQLARMRPFREWQAERRLGRRPKSAVHKESVTVRLDPKVVDFFRSSGPGWQTRMNAALAEYVRRHRPRP